MRRAQGKGWCDVTPSKRSVLRAIKASMAHWRRVWEGMDEYADGSNCPLCKRFYDRSAEDEGEECDRCPLAMAGLGCSHEESPYQAVADLDTGFDGTEEAAHMWMVLAFIYAAEASDG